MWQTKQKVQHNTAYNGPTQFQHDDNKWSQVSILHLSTALPPWTYSTRQLIQPQNNRQHTPKKRMTKHLNPTSEKWSSAILNFDVKICISFLAPHTQFKSVPITPRPRKGPQPKTFQLENTPRRQRVMATGGKKRVRARGKSTARGKSMNRSVRPSQPFTNPPTLQQPNPQSNWVPQSCSATRRRGARSKQRTQAQRKQPQRNATTRSTIQKQTKNRISKVDWIAISAIFC
jgi:hypothetical protein